MVGTEERRGAEEGRLEWNSGSQMGRGEGEGEGEGEGGEGRRGSRFEFRARFFPFSDIPRLRAAALCASGCGERTETQMGSGGLLELRAGWAFSERMLKGKVECRYG